MPYPATTRFAHLREPINTASTTDVARSDYAANGDESIFPYGTGPKSYAEEAGFPWPDQSTANGIMFGRSEVGLREVIERSTWKCLINDRLT